jgi:phosphate/sulfate permease
MSNEPPDQEKRSRETADKIRTYLTALNTGGIAVTVGVARYLASQKVSLAWAVWPVVGFVVGLVILGASLFLAKHKALKRRDNKNREFEKWYWRNFTYDLLSFAAFVVAVSILLWHLNCLLTR